MPLPIDVDLVGTTDSNGNLTIQRVVRPAYWSMMYATVQAAGSGQWTLGVESSARCYQLGTNALLGPIILRPGQQATLKVAGASPKTAVTGSLWGFQGEAQDGSDLVALLPSIMSAGSLVLPNNLLTQPTGGAASGSFPVPVGTESLSVTAIAGSGGGAGFVRVVGAVTGRLLGVVAVNGANSPGYGVFAIDSSVDTSVNWTLSLSSGTASVFLSGLPTTAPPFLPLSAFPLHVNSTSPVTPAAPYTVWRLTHDAVNPRALRIWGWVLSFDGAAGAPFASLDAVNGLIFSAPGSNGPELWNQLLSVSTVSSISWPSPVILAASDPTTQDMSLQFQAPIVASSYNVRGTMVVDVIPWFPSLATAIG